MAHQQQHGQKECKCKLLPLSLSANTAAEFGDLASLTHRLSSSKYRRAAPPSPSPPPSVVETPPPSSNEHDSSSSSSSPIIIGITHNTATPLHLAAQNGHAAITSYLLQDGYDADTGHRRYLYNTNTNTEQTSKQKIPTPLHRACHSGALSSIKLLLQNGANDMAIDYSIGDEMTPLHKAVKGGRHLAVALLLEHFKTKDQEQSQNQDQDQKVDGTRGEGESKSMDGRRYLMRALEARDKFNHTPLDLALELLSHGEEEILSVRRWDAVAGGSADWDHCVELLQYASRLHMNGNDFPSQQRVVENEKEQGYNIITSTDATLRKKNDYYSSKFIPLCDCDNGDEGDQCKTLIWESSLRAHLIQTTTNLLKPRSKEGKNRKKFEFEPICVKIEMEEADKTEENSMRISNKENTHTLTMDITIASPTIDRTENPPKAFLGQPCQNCNSNTINFFRSKSGQLVCRKCVKGSRRRRS